MITYHLISTLQIFVEKNTAKSDLISVAIQYGNAGSGTAGEGGDGSDVSGEGAGGTGKFIPPFKQLADGGAALVSVDFEGGSNGQCPWHDRH